MSLEHGEEIYFAQEDPEGSRHPGGTWRRANPDVEIQIARRISDLEQTIKRLERDVREHREEEQCSRQTAAWLQRMFERTPLPISYVDASLRILRVNRAFVQAAGIQEDRFSGTSWDEHVSDEALTARLRKALKTGTPVAIHQMIFSHRLRTDGEPARWWAGTAQPVFGADSHVEGLIVCLHETVGGGSNQTEWTRRLLDETGARRLADIGTLASTVAHELRNPLVVILTAAYNLRRKNQNPELEKHLANIEKKVAESEAIIRNLLNFARIQPPTFKRTDIAALLEESLESAVASTPKAVQLIRDWEGVRGVAVEADPGQLREVLRHVLVNALQSLADGRPGQLDVQAQLEGANLIIRIRDNGMGIVPGDIAKIFDPFFTRKSKGTGLGLTIAKSMVELHHGWINVRSHPDQGTEIIITLPRIQEKPYAQGAHDRR